MPQSKGRLERHQRPHVLRKATRGVFASCSRGLHAQKDAIFRSRAPLDLGIAKTFVQWTQFLASGLMFLYRVRNVDVNRQFPKPALSRAETTACGEWLQESTRRDYCSGDEEICLFDGFPAEG